MQRQTRWFVAVTAAVAGFCIAGCSNAAKYTKGNAPVSSPPTPGWTVLSPPSMANTFSTADGVLIRGKLKEIRQTDAPEYALAIQIIDADFGLDEPVKSAVISIKTWHAGIPDLKPGSDISISSTNRRNHEITVSDYEGVAIRSWIGESLPNAHGLPDEYPLHVTANTEPGYSNAYTEIIQSEELCRQTWVHSRMNVTTDTSQVTMSPGEAVTVTGTFKGVTRTWLVTAADDRWLDESTCAEDRPGSAFFTWLRIAKDSAADHKRINIKKLRN